MSRHNPDPNRLISWRGWFRFYLTAWRRGWEERETHPSRWCPYPCPCPFSRLKPIPKTYTFYYLPRFFNHALSDRWRAERRVWMTGSGAEPECHLRAGVIYDWRLDWQSRKSHNTWSVDRWSISQSEGSGGRGEKAVGRRKGGRRKEGYNLKWRKKLLSERYCSFLFSLMFLIVATSLLSVAVHSRVWSSSTQKSYYSHLGLHFSISITTSIWCSMSLPRPRLTPTHPLGTPTFQHPHART